MARIARVVLPGIPHHVVQRGVRSQRLFFGDPDRGEYLRLLAKQGRRHGLLYVAWCLMLNHVHLIVIPKTETSLAKGIGEAHKAYTRRINFRQATRGYLFQGRFASCPLDERHLSAAVRYALRNPVRARLVAGPADYPWSSARWHLGRASRDPLAFHYPLLARISDWAASLARDPQEMSLLRRHSRTGRPLGEPAFVELAERLTGRALRKGRPGRKPQVN